MENTIKIIPLTAFQKKLYTTFLENQAHLISNIKDWSTATLLQKYNKNYNDNFPRINLLQLHSIPDNINGVFLDYSDKQNILLGEIENLKSYTKNLQSFSIDDENNLQYINLNSNPIVIRNLTTQDTLTFQSNSSPRFTKDGEEDLKVEIIPATNEQKMIFLEHIQSLMYNHAQIVPYPVLTSEQLNSIPDYIDGNKLNTINKTQLLFEHFIPFSNNPDENISDLKTYTVSNKGELLKTFEYKDIKNSFGNTYKKVISFIKKEDCIYINKNLSQDTSNTVSEPNEIYEQTKKIDNKIHQEALINNAIREKPAYIEVCDMFSKEFVEILKKPDEEVESKKLFLNFQDKVYDALRKLGMTDHSEGLRFDFSEITSKGHQKYKTEQLNKYLIIDNELFEITGVRKDGKIYYEDIHNSDKAYTTNLEQIKNEKWTHLIDVTLEQAKKNITLKTINIMSTNVDFEKAKDLDVVGFERPLQVYDPVSIVHDGKHLQGKVNSLPSNGEIGIRITNSKDLDQLYVDPKDQGKIQPMFIINKEEKMVYLKFNYDETIAALNNKSDINLKQSKDEKSPVFNLMLGNKTDVISFEKNIDNKMAPVEGRLELRRKAGSGEAYVHGEVKHKELNLSLPIYGLHLNEQQKEDLTNKKDIGLVQGFKSNDGKEFTLWVSLDEKLNKVVTAPERSININMIFGVKTTEEQRNQIKSGEGAVVEIKGKEYLFQASAATTKADGLKSNAIDKPKDLKQDTTQQADKEEKKNKSKGLKI